MILLNLLISLVALINLSELSSAAEDVAPDELPLIWPAIGGDKTYRIMYQLQMLGSSERLTIEEWASFDKHLFRLDLITNESRVTYLTNGDTNEIFRFKPFTCDQLSTDSKELGIIGNLFKGYGLNGEESSSKVLAFGLGPLWLRSKEVSAKTTRMSNSTVEFRRHRFLSRYTGYEIKFADSDIPYNLRIFFPQEKYRFFDAVEWVDPAKSSRLDPDDVEARAKLIYIDTTPIDDSIFELPLGYGCQRQAQYERPIDVDIGSGLLHDGNPNQALLEVTTSIPRDELLNSWVSQRFTVYLLHGISVAGGNVNSYYVAATQAIDMKTSRIKRTKRVWSAPRVNATEALVYSIDETSGDCRATRMDFKDLVKLPFPVTKDSLPSSSTPIPLGIDLMKSLFNDNSDYHKLRETFTTDRAPVPKTGSFREVFYEKRLDKFELKNLDGQIVWSGPVSVVKRIKSFSIFLEQSQTKPLVSQYHTTISLFFYNEDSTKILYKAVLDLLGQDELDMSILQREIDIGPCFSENQKEDILIKYPLESEGLSHKLSAMDDLVQERFLQNIFTTTPLKPIQISGLELSFDNFFIYTKLTLIDLPLTQTFDLKRGFQLRKNNQTGSLVSTSGVIEKMSSSLEKCAATCDFYTCFRFSYDFVSFRCVLELKDGVAQIEPNFSSDLYQYVNLRIDETWAKYDEAGARSHLRPNQILEIFQEFTNYDAQSLDQDDETQLPTKKSQDLPLRIKIDSALLPADSLPEDDYLELRPISVYSDMDSINEFVREEQTNYTSSADSDSVSNSTIVKVHEATNLQVQYNILYEGRQFNRDQGELLFQMSFDDCSELCESRDCRSFSYCNSMSYCLVTNLHKTADIKRATLVEPLCSIHILDYLSKFEDFGLTLQPPVVKSVLGGTSKEDCAYACMEEQSFNCQGFYQCKRFDLAIEDETVSCLLQDKHIEEGSPNDQSSPKFQTTLMTTKRKTKTSVECRYFSRSYLSQFDEYLGKALKFEMSDNLADAVAQTEVVVGLGAELCAKKCIQESCLAYHVCLDPLDHSHVCELAKRQVRKTNLVTRKRCTTFVLSDKSHFNLKKTKLIAAEPDRSALDKDTNAPDVVLDPEQQADLKRDIYSNLFDWFWSLEEVKQVKVGSNLLSKFMSLLMGSLTGVFCAIVWLKRDSVYNLATRVGSYYRSRG